MLGDESSEWRKVNTNVKEEVDPEITELQTAVSQVINLIGVYANAKYEAKVIKASAQQAERTRENALTALKLQLNVILDDE